MAGALTNKLGCRFVTIFGAFLESFGWFLSAFTPNLEFLYVTFGVLVGTFSVYIIAYIQSNLDSSNTECPFIMAYSNLFLSP